MSNTKDQETSKVAAFARRLIRRGMLPIEHTILRATIYSHDTYQPINHQKPLSSGRSDSAFSVRWAQTEKAIDQFNARNMLDIGCAEGYFVRQCALQKGIFALGVDADRRRVKAGNALRELRKERGYGLLTAQADEDFISHLPTFDVVVCFSVLHHIIARQGLDNARAFLQSIANITNHCLLFEMGSPEETEHDWAKSLQFLNNDVPGKTATFLTENGFSDVRHIADTTGYDNTVARPLFICRPSRTPKK